MTNIENESVISNVSRRESVEGQALFTSFPYYLKLLLWAQKVGVIGYSISFCFLVVASLILIAFKRLHCSRNFIHVNFFVALALRCVMCIFTFVRTKFSLWTDDQHFCKLSSTLWNYTIIASFFWLLVESAYLHNRVYFVFHKVNTKVYVAFGWASSVFLTIVWAIVRLTQDDYLCWIQYKNINYIWIIGAPMTCIFIVNFFLFTNVVRMLYAKYRNSNLSELDTHKRLAKSTFTLVIIFGVEYFVFSLGILIVGVEKHSFALTVFLFIEQCCSSLQGVLVTVVYCFSNNEVVEEVRLWRSRRRLRYSIDKQCDQRRRSSSVAARSDGGVNSASYNRSGAVLLLDTAAHKNNIDNNINDVIIDRKDTHAAPKQNNSYILKLFRTGRSTIFGSSSPPRTTDDKKARVHSCCSTTVLAGHKLGRTVSTSFDQQTLTGLLLHESPMIVNDVEKQHSRQQNGGIRASVA